MKTPVVALVIFLLRTGTVAAQSDSLAERITLAIRGHHQVLLRTDDRRVVVSEPSVSGDHLSFRASSDSARGPIPLAAIRTIAVRRSAWREGAAAGAAAGVLGGMGDDLVCGPDCGAPEGWGTLFGGVGGAAVGALIGSAVRSWKVVYTADRGT